ncbi:MAG: DUF4111 domain-containing protein [Chloroflexota bacterium]|nr:DUF4111 domain-containing protein [Chloroflexota bacterium]
MIEHSLCELPADVRRVVTRYLQLVDEALRDCIEGLYLVGSLALDDYQAGQSDIDFVAVTADPLTAGEMDRLEAIHQALLADVGRPWFDGIYVTRSDLEHNPADAGSIPSSHEGQFERSGGFEANPVTWLTLRNHPRPMRSPIPTVWHDRDFLQRWNLDNLNSYWAGMAAQLKAGAPRPPEEAIPQVIAWCVPGVVRLAYTIATGDVTSKSGACRYALTTYPERWRPIVSEALAIRIGARLPAPVWSSPIADTIAFMRQVIAAENERVALSEPVKD